MLKCRKIAMESCWQRDMTAHHSALYNIHMYIHHISIFIFFSNYHILPAISSSNLSACATTPLCLQDARGQNLPQLAFACQVPAGQWISPRPRTTMEPWIPLQSSEEKWMELDIAPNASWQRRSQLRPSINLQHPGEHFAHGWKNCACWEWCLLYAGQCLAKDI